MAQINWDETDPANSKARGQGAGDIRSFKTAVRTGMGEEHVWPSASGAAGVHLPGSGRPYYGAHSAVSSTGTDARTMVTSDKSDYWHVGALAAHYLGGARTISAGSFPQGVTPQIAKIAVEFGVGATTDSSASTTIVLPNSGFSGTFVVVATILSSTSFKSVAQIDRQNAGQSFVVQTQDVSGSSVQRSFNWIAIGSRALGA